MATRQIILMRHAKSDWESGARSDHARPLNHRGRRNAPMAGRWMASIGIHPDVILCSDAERTRETLELVLEASGWKEDEMDIRYESALYLADADTILDYIQDALADHDSVMLVGHNPGMDYTLLELCPDSRNLAGDKLMTTAAVAILEVPDDFQDEARLVEFKRPADME